VRPLHNSAAPAALLALALACSGGDGSATAPSRPSRGYILISIDALRADALGLYGSARPTSPFLDRFAESSLVFENAFVQIPSTLPSHLSMFTGLFPSQHNVFPPSDVLAESIPTLPELFRAAGYRTIGHSEGGYVVGGYGFSRGFDEWTDTGYASDEDIERTFSRGIASLEGLGPDERFFLFLHTYSVHDPYEPPERYRKEYWPGPPPEGAFEPLGPNFSAYNSGHLDAPRQAMPYYRALYDASVRHMDDVVAHFWSELERLGLADEVTLIFTSDHGEEFLEHGRYVHTQAYPESLRIPLVVHAPGRARGRRVQRLASTIDFLPTLAELAGLELPAGLPGTSFADLLAGGDGRLSGRAWAQDEILAFQIRTLMMPVGGRLLQVYTSRAVQERDGYWMAREVAFDAVPPAIEFRTVAFHRPRRLTVLVDDEPLRELEIGTEWSAHRIELPPGRKHVVTMRTDGCDSPFDLGQGRDARCLSIKLDGLVLARLELYDLAADPGAQRDLSGERPDLVRALVRELRAYPETPVAESTSTELSDEQIRRLKALGYLGP